MKNVSTSLTAHVKQEVTSLCTCWRIVRTDGVTYGFTDCDVDVAYNGIVYESETGYNRTAISGDSTFGVDNLDVSGFLDSAKISENDLRNGLFDFASVFIFMLNWNDPSMGEIKLRRGWFGEVTQTQTGMFHTEVRGLNQALSHNIMESFTPDCKADFCDLRCKLNKANFAYNGTVFSAASRQVFSASSLPVVATTGSTTVGAHRYWRIRHVATPYTDYAGFAEIKFFDQANAEITGGGVSVYSTRDRTGDPSGIGLFGTGYSGGNARDGNVNSKWLTKENDAAVGWLRLDFGSAKDVKSIIMRAPQDDYQFAPTTFELQYSDNDINWTMAKSCTTRWNSNGQEATWTIGSATSDPVDFPTSQTAVPPPQAGASTYVGGTIEFITGPNTGKSLEIIDYNPSNYTVTVFEMFPYAVSKGDKFIITQGCDKLFTTCMVYGNQKNFRGEPHVPGEDELMKYPDAHS